MTNNMDLMLSHFMEKEFQSRINFQELMEKVNVAIYLIKIGDQKPAYINQAMCDLQGLSRNEILSSPFHSSLHPDDLTRVMQLVEQRRKGQVSDTQYPLRIRHSSGKYIVVNIRNRQVVIDGEHYTLSTLHDITDFVEMEIALKSSEEKLRYTFAAMEDLVFVTDTDSYIREFYQPDHPDLYVTPDKFLNKKFENVLPEPVAEIYNEALHQTLTTNRSTSIEYALDIGDKIKTFNAKLSVIKGKDNVNSGVVVVVRDITEKVETEKALRESEERYRSLFKSMFTAYALHEIITNKRGKPINYRYLDVNPAFEKLIGLKATDVIGKTVLELFPQTEAYWIDTFGQVAQTGKSAKMTEYSKDLNKKLQVHARSPKKGQFAAAFVEIK